MPLRHTRLAETSAWIEENLRAVRTELGIEVDFPAEVEAEAAEAARDVELPDADGTAIPFVTIDPEGSKDLDQAVSIARDGSGFTVWYAIADLAAVVKPGGAIDVEAHRRGQTLYAPDTNAPLHPRVLSEDAASLLPRRERSAYVWRMSLDARGAVQETTLTRMRVRSRSRLSYREVQQRIDDGDTDLGLLREVGLLRLAQERERGGASLDLPDEEVTLRAGRWTIERRTLLPVESWNAQISLMTGMEAAQLQLHAGQGILRTMPPAPQDELADFRRDVAALGVPWRDDEEYGAYLRALPDHSPVTLAILTRARHLFRGAGYLVLDGTERPADQVTQSAIGAPYAHTTAPLRRLVDRYVLAHCEAIANGRPVPEWASTGAAALPAIMQTSGGLAGKLERESIAVVTTAVLEPLVGAEFDAIVVERRGTDATVELIEPPVEASAVLDAQPGERVRVRLEAVDMTKRTSRFVSASAPPPNAAPESASPGAGG